MSSKRTSVFINRPPFVGQDEYTQLNGDGKRKAMARSNVAVIVVLSVFAVVAVAALVIAIVALIRATHNPLDETVNHGPPRDVGDKWLYRGRDLDNSAYSPRTQINSGNVHTLVEAFKSQIGQDPSLGGTINGAFRADVNWGSATVDDQYIILATNNQRNEAGTILDGTGYIMAFNRQTGARVWNRAVTSYSLDNLAAQAGADFEAAAAIHGDFIYIGTKNSKPQTYANPPYQTITNPTFFGFPTSAKARRTHVYCINKHTGAEVWAKELGEVATHYGSPDNLLAISMSPVAFDMDPTGGNNPIPVVAIGTTSGNSFVPDFSGSDETTAKGYAAISGGTFGLGTDPNTRLTDVGRMFLLNGLTGDIISETRAGPQLYKAGDTLREESIVYGDNSELYDMEIWHIVQAADIAGAGELNPIINRYTKSKMIISIMPGATIVVGSPLVGLAVQDNTGANHVIAAGAAPANLDYVTVVLEVEFVPGTTDFYRLSPQPSGSAFDTTAADLDGAAGNVPARIVKQLRVGDTLTDQDAYECNYYGASFWGSNPSINFGSDGKPKEMYVATGQAHKIPYDEMKRFDVTKPPSPFATPVERIWNIKYAQEAYISNPTQPNLDAERAAKEQRILDLQAARKVPISSNGRNFHYNSVVAINLRPGHIGEIMWTEKYVGYDTWRVGLLNDQQRQNENGNLLGFTNAEAHHGMLRGHDSDYSECPYFCPNCGEHGGDLIIAPNKGGGVQVIKLSDVNLGPTTHQVVAENLIGNPGLLGGSEYGSTMIKSQKLLVTSQGNEAAAFVTTVDRPFNRRSLVPAMSWFPANQNVAGSVTPFTHRQSFLSGYDVLTNKIIFEVPYQTEAPGKDRTTVTAISGGADLIYVQPNNHIMQIRRISDGALVHTLPLDSAGVSNIAVLDRELVIANGRQGFFADNPAGTSYNGIKYVYKYKLP